MMTYDRDYPVDLVILGAEALVAYLTFRGIFQDNPNRQH